MMSLFRTIRNILGHDPKATDIPISASLYLTQFLKLGFEVFRKQLSMMDNQAANRGTGPSVSIPRMDPYEDKQWGIALQFLMMYDQRNLLCVPNSLEYSEQKILEKHFWVGLLASTPTKFKKAPDFRVVTIFLNDGTCGTQIKSLNSKAEAAIVLIFGDWNPQFLTSMFTQAATHAGISRFNIITDQPSDCWKDCVPRECSVYQVCYLKKESFIARVRSYYQTKTEYAIPTNPEDETPHFILHEDYASLQLLGEVVGMFVEPCTEEKLKKKREEFAKGGEASWEIIHHGYTVKRDLEDTLFPIICHECNRNQTQKKIRISHHPCRGGTTFGRQLLFRLSKKFPCIIVSPHMSMSSRQDFVKLLRLLDPNKKSVPPCILLCDNLEDEKLDAFEGAGDLPIVLLVLTRHRKAEYTLNTNLSDRELERARKLFPEISRNLNVEETWYEEAEIGREGQAFQMPNDILFFGILYFTNLAHNIALRLLKLMQSIPENQREAFTLLCMVFYYTAGTITIHKSELSLLGMPYQFEAVLENLVLKNEIQVRPWHREFGKQLAFLYSQTKRVNLLEKSIKLAHKDAHLMKTLETMLYKTKEGGDFTMLVVDLTATNPDDSEKLLRTAANSFKDVASHVHYARFLYRHKRDFQKAVEILNHVNHRFEETASFLCTFGDVYRTWYKREQLLEYATSSAMYYRKSLGKRNSNSRAILGFLKIVAHAFKYLPQTIPKDGYSFIMDAAALYLHSFYFDHKINFRETWGKLEIPTRLILLAADRAEREQIVNTIYEYTLLGLQHIADNNNLPNAQKARECIHLATKPPVTYLRGGFLEAGYFLNVYFNFLDLLEGNENDLDTALRNFENIYETSNENSLCEFRTLYINWVGSQFVLDYRKVQPLGDLIQHDKYVEFRGSPLPNVVKCNSSEGNGPFSGWIMIQVKSGRVNFTLSRAT